MSIKRDTIPFGPAKIVFGSTTFYSAGEVDVEVNTEFADVNSDQYGQGVKTIVDQTIEVKFKPQSLWSILGNVFPTSHISPTIGSRLIGGSPSTLVLHGEDSSLLTVEAACITGLSSLMLGVDKGEFGDIKFSGVVTNAKKIGDSGSLFTYAASGGTYDTPSAPDYLAAAQWDAVWGSSVLTGTLLNSVSINPDLKIEPVKIGHQTVDYRIQGCEFSAGLHFADDLVARAALFNDAASFIYGGRNSTLGKDLVLTSATGNTFTMKTAMLEKAGMKFSMKEARNAPVEFRTAALTGARISWT